MYAIRNPAWLVSVVEGEGFGLILKGYIFSICWLVSSDLGFRFVWFGDGATSEGDPRVRREEGGESGWRVRVREGLFLG